MKIIIDGNHSVTNHVILSTFSVLQKNQNSLIQPKYPHHLFANSRVGIALNQGFQRL